MPAAAVIPAPIAYIKVVAVKKLVVGFLRVVLLPSFERFSVDTHPISFEFSGWSLLTRSFKIVPFTVRKLECSRQAFCN